MQSHILHFLKNTGSYISGEEISQHLNISRAAVWKYIQELREEGYDIVAVPHLGYRFVSSPDKLTSVEIQFGLNTKIFGRKIYAFDSVDSTMDFAFRLGLEGALEGTLVCAEGQTKGRGRLGRQWHSPKGKGIYASIILRPSLPPSIVSQLTLLSAVSMCEAIKKVCHLQTAIKWPNDILVGNKKLAGILTELSAEMDRVRFVVIGFGLNVNTSSSLLPSSATSLKHELHRSVSRTELMQEILRYLEKWYQILGKEGFLKIVQRWKELSSTLGRRVRVEGIGEYIEGEAIDMDENGSLIIRNDAGIKFKRISGDVVFVR